MVETMSFNLIVPLAEETIFILRVPGLKAMKYLRLQSYKLQSFFNLIDQ